MTDSAPEEGAQFWEWSNRIYRRKGVSEVLIKLQDAYRLDVNIILWCAWVGEFFGAAPELALRKAEDLSRLWGGGVVAKLREVRRTLKSPPMQADAAAADALRTSVKDAELEAERIEQGILETLAREFTSQITPADAKSAARRNLAIYARLSNVTEIKGFSTSELEHALDLLFPDGENGGTHQDEAQ